MNQRVNKNITTVIFDLGGVLFDIDYKRTQDAFQKLNTLADFETVYSQQKQAGIFDDFEKGLISPAQFRQGLGQWLPSAVTDKQINQAWCALLLGFSKGKIELLTKLKDRYTIFLLSNTNEIHLPEVIKMIDNDYGKDAMDKLFTKTYYSCRMGLRKPDKEIYETVINENKLLPSHTLFIDDLLQNVEGAQLTGLQTLHCTPSVNLEEYFAA